MSLIQTLSEFQSNATQCENLIANAHQTDPSGTPLLPLLDQQQITVAAFLNLFVAWETFLEDSLTKLMIGLSTISGQTPTRFVIPPDTQSAKLIVIGTQRYFDYANLDNMRKIVNLYFKNGYPFEPHLSSVQSDISDLRTMRNAAAHITSTTQTALESLAQRILRTPQPGIILYTLLTSIPPGSPSGNTVFAESKGKLDTIATLIAQG